jgi:hypothetical protein
MVESIDAWGLGGTYDEVNGPWLKSIKQIRYKSNSDVLLASKSRFLLDS